MPPVNKNKAKKVAVEQPKESEKVISGQLKKKLDKPKKNIDKRQHGLVMIKHLPHGFFETQLRKYFQQFGDVTRVRLARSKRTGGSKGFAYVEFEYPEVAQVAAETMNNYLMFKKVVKATYIPPEEQRFNYFRTTVRKVKNKVGNDIFVSSKSGSIVRKIKKHNEWSDNDFQKRTQARLKKVNKLNKKFEHLGIDFNQILTEPKFLEKGSKDAEEDEQPGTSKLAMKNKKPKQEKKPTDQLLQDSNDSESETDDDEDDDDEQSEEEEEPPMPAIKKSKNFSKKSGPLKSIEKLITKKPLEGGIQKKKLVNKKPQQKSKTVQKAAISELKKPSLTLNSKQKLNKASVKKRK